MNAVRRFLATIFYWTYPRGSWQWDIYCLVIIVIIFSTPWNFLESFTRSPLSPEEIRKVILDFFRAL